MCRPAFTAELITFASKRVEMGVGVAEVRRLKMLEEKNRRPKQLVVDPRRDTVTRQDASQRKF